MPGIRTSDVMLQAQGHNLKEILVELQAKADDLEDAIRHRTSTKNAMKVRNDDTLDWK